MNDNDDVIIARSYVFDETLCFSFQKDNVDHISEAGLAADTTKVWNNLNNTNFVTMKWQ